jgi:hypothetical protein
MESIAGCAVSSRPDRAEDDGRSEEARMFHRRLAADRGHAQRGWPDSWHTFSFADYYGPEHLLLVAMAVR